MGLFGNSKKQNERKKLKSKVDRLMKSYSKEKIDGDTYLKKMMDLTSSYQKKKKVNVNLNIREVLLQI